MSKPWYSFMMNTQYLAQVGHFFGAFSLIFTSGAFFGHHLNPIFITGIALAAVKEFWFDLVYEKDSLPDSLMDFTFYVLGGLLGVLLHHVAVIHHTCFV